ncbi:hypothetical protein [Pseudomonas sp. NA-150]|uniref:hypothetical protein n=1 Tax=Pseudomonas sp. NA-150 TaxID=3367525 RepID=UPI0037C61999
MTTADAIVQTPRRIKLGSLAECLPTDCLTLAARQFALSKPQLQELQSRICGPSGLLAAFATQVAEQGRQAPDLQVLPDSADPLRRLLTERSIRFALARHHRRAFAKNPFAGLPRRTLCAVVYDDTRTYNLAERYAALEELRASDSRFFVKLIATTRETVERRLVFLGLIEHFDSLLPVEQSIYLFGYREVQVEHLHREEELYGKLKLHEPLWRMLAEESPQNVVASLEAGE